MDRKKQKLLSLCMITKNEEERLPVCLENIKNVVDEIIIVDTGSIDQTVQTAKQLGAKVYKRKWKNDFSEIRNYAIEKASGKWILVLDPDEIMPEEDAKKIKLLLNNPMAEGYLFYIHTFLTNHAASSQTQSLRLFRNRKNYRYQNKIFEHIPDESITNVLDSEIQIFHYPDPVRFEEMRKLKMNLLTQEINQDPDNTYLHYVYGIELLNQKKYQEGVDQFQAAIKNINHDHVFSPHLYKLLALTQLQQKNYTEAITSANKGLRHYPFFTDLVFLRGQSHRNLSFYHEALQDFEQCLKLGDAPAAMVSEEGLGSYKALFALGNIHEELLNVDRALEYYKKAYSINKEFEDPLYQIGTLVKENPKLGKIDSTLSQLLDLSKPDEMMTLIDILCLEREAATALHYLEKIEEMNVMKEDAAFVKGICHMISGNQTEAEKNYSLIREEHPFYDQVLLRRIQNFWFHQLWESAEKLIPAIIASTKLKNSTKEIYTIVHSILKGEKAQFIDLDESGYHTLAKLLESLLWMKVDIKENQLLDWLLQSPIKDLYLTIGKIFTLQQDMESVFKIYNHIQDKDLQKKYREKTAQKAYQSGNLKNAEKILMLGESDEKGVLSYYLWHKIRIKNTLDTISMLIKSKKTDQKVKEQISQLAEWIANED